jgi:hypothetical protein
MKLLLNMNILIGGKDSIHIKNVENETHDKNLFLNRQSNKFYL